MHNPPHPGRMLAESLEYLGISAEDFARKIGVHPSSLRQVLSQEGPITPVLAERITAALPGPSAAVWLAIQADFDKHKQAAANP